MSAKRNKKVLCFIDEHGTPGQGDLYFGIVTVLSIDNGRLDKCFSDQLHDNANEIHAAELNDDYLKSLMKEFHQNAPENCFTLINRKVSAREGSSPFVYACGLIDAVKVGISTFKKDILKALSINNVEVIIDRNNYNTHKDFEIEISNARSHDNKFKAVTHIAAIDSAASRMLQLADIAAYSRKFINNKSMTAQELNRLYGIQTK
jgi:Protein of unknown function (DUF3800)